ncbi:hypothetical protein BKA66DRAFT_440118 [Pyrenochaeta sp. MPI-SDFR-AT-0127]|nr:hypothetical protein BKA66DRAFT_440118 [Pyrenochaeta sp. MPI-SDFR-AT-0127]
MTKVPGSEEHGGRKLSTKQASKSTKFAPKPASSTGLILKIRLAPNPVQTSSVASPKGILFPPPASQHEPCKIDDELHVEQKPPTKTRRSGRPTRKPRNTEGCVMGSELDHAIELDSNGKSDNEDHYDIPSSPPFEPNRGNIHILQLPPERKPSCPSQSAITQPALGKVDTEDSDLFKTMEVSSPHRLPRNGVRLADIEPAMYEIMNYLCRDSKIYVDLPDLSNTTDPDSEQPYTAKQLTHLYLLCYDSQLWNLCDLIADTWIRAFQRLRKYDEKDAHHQLWRRNTSLENRKRELSKKERKLKGKAQKFTKNLPNGIGFDPSPPDYALTTLDPELTEDVTEFNTDLLNNLYEYTNKTCGARLLWADAMSLSGDKMENAIDKWTKQGYKLHADLLFNIMQTSLRMVRRKLTLKIEESTEGAWCKRYHEHSKHGLPCYRELAWYKASMEDGKETEGEGDADVEMRM